MQFYNEFITFNKLVDINDINLKLPKWWSTYKE